MSSVPQLRKMTGMQVTYITASLVCELPTQDFNIFLYTLYVIQDDLHEMPDKSKTTLLMIKAKGNQPNKNNQIL